MRPEVTQPLPEPSGAEQLKPCRGVRAWVIHTRISYTLTTAPRVLGRPTIDPSRLQLGSRCDCAVTRPRRRDASIDDSPHEPSSESVAETFASSSKLIDRDEATFEEVTESIIKRTGVAWTGVQKKRVDPGGAPMGWTVAPWQQPPSSWLNQGTLSIPQCSEVGSQQAKKRSSPGFGEGGAGRSARGKKKFHEISHET